MPNTAITASANQPNITKICAHSRWITGVKITARMAGPAAIAATGHMLGQSKPRSKPAATPAAITLSQIKQTGMKLKRREEKVI